MHTDKYAVVRCFLMSSYSRYTFVTVAILVQTLIIVAMLCILIHCSTVKLDIPFLAKRIHVESTLIFKDDSVIPE
jgi:hypothetical protein